MQRILLFISLLVAIAPSARAGERIINDPSLAPAGLMLSRAGQASAFLVGPCTAVTAAHAVHRRAIGARVKFTAMQSAKRERSRGTITRIGPFRGGLEFSSSDWAEIALDNCIGRQVGWFEIADKDDALHRPVTAVGYPGRNDFHEGITAVDCEIRYIERSGIVALGCELMVGMSGGPILVRGADGQWQVAGINSTVSWRDKMSFGAPVPILTPAPPARDAILALR